MSSFSRARRWSSAPIIDDSSCGAPRIHREPLKLGVAIAQRSVAKYMIPRVHRPLSQNWKTLLRNHLCSIVSVDFLTVPTLSFTSFTSL